MPYEAIVWLSPSSLHHDPYARPPTRSDRRQARRREPREQVGTRAAGTKGGRADDVCECTGVDGRSPRSRAVRHVVRCEEYRPSALDVQPITRAWTTPRADR